MSYWDDVTPHSVASAQDGFKEFRIGDNEAFVKMAEEKTSESGNTMLVITFANYEGAEIKHFIVDGEYKLQKLKQFYIAFGIPLGSRDIEEWRGKRGIVVCKQGEPYNGKVYNKVSYLRAKPNPNQPSAGNIQPGNTQKRQPFQPPAVSEDTAQGDDFEDDIPF